MECCRIVNGIINKNIKNSLGTKWNASHLAEGLSNFPNDFAWQGRDTSRTLQIADIQYDTTIMDEREVSRPYRVWFFAEGERFLSFWRCHRPRKRPAFVLWCG